MVMGSSPIVCIFICFFFVYVVGVSAQKPAWQRRLRPVYLVILNFYGETVTHLYLSPSPTFYSISTWLPSLRNVAVDQGRLDDGRRVAVKQLSVGKSGQGESEFFVEVNMIKTKIKKI
jgi:hypothetical protein